VISGTPRQHGGGEGDLVLTAAAIAEAVSGELVGDPSVVVSGVAALDRATRHDLSFLAAAKYAPLFATSRAGVVLILPELARAPGEAPARIVVERPQEALLTLLPRFHRGATARPGVHPTAVLGAGVRLGASVSVGPYAVIGDGVELGEGSVVGPHCVLGDGVTIGQRCHLIASVTAYSGSRIGDRVSRLVARRGRAPYLAPHGAERVRSARHYAERTYPGAAADSWSGAAYGPAGLQHYGDSVRSRL